MKFTNVTKALPTTTGFYTVKYQSPKSSKVRTGKAKYLKTKGFTQVTGVSGKPIGLNSSVLTVRLDSSHGTPDTRPSSRPRVVAWA